VRQIVNAAAKDNYSFAAIVAGIVQSDAFRLQGAEEQLTQATASVAASE
jgi:hypothetical protein